MSGPQRRPYPRELYADNVVVLKPLDTSSAETGELGFSVDRGTIEWWDGDNIEWPTFVDDVITSDETVANTATATEVFNPDINQNSLKVGRIYQIELNGVFSTVNNSDTFTVDVYIGNTLVSSLQNSPANVSDAPWNATVTFSVRSEGSNGEVTIDAQGLFDEQSRADHFGTLTVDTTTTTNLSVEINWGTANVDNTVTLTQAHLKQMG